MSTLVAVALGPVSSFVSSGRRSRDLWYGSRFLSEATRVAALHLRAQQVDLILPRQERLEERHVTFQHERPTISNKILGRVPAGLDAATLLRDAEAHARSFLAKEISELSTDDRTKGLIVGAAVEAQAKAMMHGDFLEFYGAWIPDTGRFDQNLVRLLRLLDGRKQARLFGAPASSPGVGKSALDAGRDSVLIEVDARDAPDAARWLDVLQAHAFIRPGERLDAVGLVRRRAAFRVQGAELEGLTFPSLARVAIDPWIEGARRREPELLDQVRDRLVALDRQRRGPHSPLYFVTTPVRDPAGGSEFRYDPEVLFDNAIPALVRATAEDTRRGRPSVVTHGSPPVDFASKGRGADWVFSEARRALTDLADPVRSLHKRLGAPIPYVAVLEADGDGVGKLVQQQVVFGDAQRVATALYNFADQAWPTIEAHRGCAYYAAGDELAAYLPVDRALDAAACLATMFKDHLEKGGIFGSSLSVGLVIAHVKDDLRVLRRRAHEALKAAKARRVPDPRTVGSSTESYLAVVELPRAGSERTFIGPTRSLVDRHRQWRTLLQKEQLSLALVHDLLGLADRFSPLADARDGDTGGDLGLDLAKSMVGHKALRSGQPSAAETVQAMQAATKRWMNWNHVRDFTAEVVVAERALRIAAQRGTP